MSKQKLRFEKVVKVDWKIVIGVPLFNFAVLSTIFFWIKEPSNLVNNSFIFLGILFHFLIAYFLERKVYWEETE